MKTNFKNVQKKCIELYSKHKYLRDIFINLNKIGMQPTDDALIKQLNDLDERINFNAYNILVMGQMSSGKSTFINALISFDLLPESHNQCTSKPTKLKNAATIGLEITFANQPTKPKSINVDKSSIQTELSNYVTVKQEYSVIADIKKVDDFLITKPDDTKIAQFIKTQIEKKQEALVQKYIREYRDLSNLVAEVLITYPFSFQMEDREINLTIIDSPGLGAVGGHSHYTNAIIKQQNIDAVIYLIRSDRTEMNDSERDENLKSFSDQDLAERLLILCTHTSGMGIDAKREQMQKLNRILNISLPKERVMLVDSLQKKVSDAFLMGQTMMDMPDIFYNLCVQRKYQGLSGAELQKRMLTESNFGEVMSALTQLKIAQGAVGRFIKVFTELVKSGNQQIDQFIANRKESLFEAKDVVEKKRKERLSRIKDFREIVATELSNQKRDEFILKYQKEVDDLIKKYIDEIKAFIRIAKTEFDSQSQAESYIATNFNRFASNFSRDSQNLLDKISAKVEADYKNVLEKLNEKIIIAVAKSQTISGHSGGIEVVRADYWGAGFEVGASIGSVVGFIVVLPLVSTLAAPLAIAFGVVGALTGFLPFGLLGGKIGSRFKKNKYLVYESIYETQFATLIDSLTIAAEALKTQVAKFICDYHEQLRDGINKNIRHQEREIEILIEEANADHKQSYEQLIASAELLLNEGKEQFEQLSQIRAKLSSPNL